MADQGNGTSPLKNVLGLKYEHRIRLDNIIVAVSIMVTFSLWYVDKGREDSKYVNAQTQIVALLAQRLDNDEKSQKDFVDSERAYDKDVREALDRLSTQFYSLREDFAKASGLQKH